MSYASSDHQHHMHIELANSLLSSGWADRNDPKHHKLHKSLIWARDLELWEIPQISMKPEDSSSYYVINKSKQQLISPNLRSHNFVQKGGIPKGHHIHRWSKRNIEEIDYQPNCNTPFKDPRVTIVPCNEQALHSKEPWIQTVRRLVPKVMQKLRFQHAVLTSSANKLINTAMNFPLNTKKIKITL